MTPQVEFKDIELKKKNTEAQIIIEDYYESRPKFTDSNKKSVLQNLVFTATGKKCHFRGNFDGIKDLQSADLRCTF